MGKKWRGGFGGEARGGLGRRSGTGLEGEAPDFFDGVVGCAVYRSRITLLATSAMGSVAYGPISSLTWARDTHNVSCTATALIIRDGESTRVPLSITWSSTVQYVSLVCCWIIWQATRLTANACVCEREGGMEHAGMRAFWLLSFCRCQNQPFGAT